MRLKLEIINMLYGDFYPANIRDAVEVKYTVGLRKLAEYEIYEKIYSFKEEDKNTVRRKILDYMEESCN